MKMPLDTHFATATKRRSQRGFTLIELMIVIAILSILSAISFPQYQKFIAKSKLAAAFAEMSAGKIGVEAAIAEGVRVSSPDEVGLPNATERCESVSVETNIGTGFASITCSLFPDAMYGSGQLEISRQSAGELWECRTTLQNGGSLIWLPKGCQ